MSVRLIIAVLLLTAFGWAQDPCARPGQCVRITWVGQACFLVANAEGGAVVVTDPPAANIGYAIPPVAANAVTITHDHGDHNNSAGVRGSFTLVDGRPVTARQEMTVAGLPFVLIPGFHDNQNGAQRGRNTIMRWSQNGLSFAHFGDYGQDALSAEQLAELRGVDVIFVPAGGFFTIDGPRVAALIAQINPRVAILMHFRTALGGAAQTAGFPAVVAPFAEVTYAPSSVLLNRATLSPAAPPVVMIMEPLADAGAVNAASFAAGAPVAPGSLVSLFGNFTASATASAAALPLPRRLQETEVLVGGAAVPLLYVSPAQINFQAPRLPPGQVVVEARVGGQRVARGSLSVIPTAPGLFAVLNQDGRPNSPANPARRGQVIQIYATGQGEVTPPVEDGAAAPAQPLSVAAVPPEVHLGFTRAAVEFSGLAPGFAGVWQINVRIPTSASPGVSLPLTVIQALRSNTISVAID